MEAVDDLKAYLSTLSDSPANYGIAVAALIFTPDDKVILLERGSEARDAVGKLEGVGGGIDDDKNLHDALKREIREEIGGVEVEVDEMLTVKILPSSKDPEYKWVVVDFLCRLVRGKPENMEPNKCNAIHELALSEIPQDRLSKYQRQAMDVYEKRYGNIPYYK